MLSQLQKPTATLSFISFSPVAKTPDRACILSDTSTDGWDLYCLTTTESFESFSLRTFIVSERRGFRGPGHLVSGAD